MPSREAIVLTEDTAARAWLCPPSERDAFATQAAKDFLEYDGTLWDAAGEAPPGTPEERLQHFTEQVRAACVRLWRVRDYAHLVASDEQRQRWITAGGRRIEIVLDPSDGTRTFNVTGGD